MEGLSEDQIREQLIMFNTYDRKDFWRRIYNKLIVRGVGFSNYEGRILNSMMAGTTWIEAMPPSLTQSYRQQYKCVKTSKSPYLNAIKRDVLRTVRSNDSGLSVLFDFTEREKTKFAKSMERILSGSSMVYDFGYCQGINYVVDVLLKAGVPEEDSFCLLMFGLRSRNIWGLYRSDVPILADFMAEFENLVKKNIPDLANHFEEEGYQCSLYALEWLTTLFALSCAPKLTLAVWDLFFHGFKDVLLKVALACLVEMREKLLSMDHESLMSTFRDLAYRIDAEEVILLVFDLDFSRKGEKGYQPELLLQLHCKYSPKTSLRQGVLDSIDLAEKHPRLGAAARNVSRFIGFMELYWVWKDEIEYAIDDWKRYCLADSLLRFSIVEQLSPRVTAFALAAGANPNSQDLRLLTPLHLCMLFNRPDCARLLLLAGADSSLRGGAHPLQNPVLNLRPVRLGSGYSLSDLSPSAVATPGGTGAESPAHTHSAFGLVKDWSRRFAALQQTPIAPEATAAVLVLQGDVCLHCNALFTGASPHRRQQCQLCGLHFCAAPQSSHDEEIKNQATPRRTSPIVPRRMENISLNPNHFSCFHLHFCFVQRAQERSISATSSHSTASSKQDRERERGWSELSRGEIERQNDNLIAGFLQSVANIFQGNQLDAHVKLDKNTSADFSQVDDNYYSLKLKKTVEHVIARTSVPVSSPRDSKIGKGEHESLIDMMSYILVRADPQPYQWWYLAYLLPHKIQPEVFRLHENRSPSTIFSVDLENIPSPNDLQLKAENDHVNWAIKCLVREKSGNQIVNRVKRNGQELPQEAPMQSIPRGNQKLSVVTNFDLATDFLVPDNLYQEESLVWCCPICFVVFTTFSLSRRQHCQGCGAVYCYEHCPKTHHSLRSTRVRLCKYCVEEIDCLMGLHSPSTGLTTEKSEKAVAVEDGNSTEARYSEAFAYPKNQIKFVKETVQNPKRENRSLSKSILTKFFAQSFDDIITVEY